jgi:hypothetical protein
LVIIKKLYYDAWPTKYQGLHDCKTAANPFLNVRCNGIVENAFFYTAPFSLEILRFKYTSLSKVIIILKTTELTFRHSGTFYSKLKVEFGLDKF